MRAQSSSTCFSQNYRISFPLRRGEEKKFIHMSLVMLALDAADRKCASHLLTTPDTPWLPAISLMPLGMHQGKASPELGNWVTPLYSWQKCRHGPIKEVYKRLLLGISCGIMASQATIITTYNVWGAKVKGLSEGKCGKKVNFLVCFAYNQGRVKFPVPGQKHYRYPKNCYV